nr:MAG TPA: hypothetical protein [Caudoviricetes sp.]
MRLRKQNELLAERTNKTIEKPSNQFNKFH